MTTIIHNHLLSLHVRNLGIVCPKAWKTTNNKTSKISHKKQKNLAVLKFTFGIKLWLPGCEPSFVVQAAVVVVEVVVEVVSVVVVVGAVVVVVPAVVVTHAGTVVVQTYRKQNSMP